MACGEATDLTGKQGNAGNVGVLPYNDKTDKGSNTNGVLMWETTGEDATQTMGDSAIWITSSCPGFGVKAFGYGFNANCQTLGQHAQCFTFDPKALIPDGAASWLSFGGVASNLNPTSDNAPWTDTSADENKVQKRFRTSQMEMVALHLIYRQAHILPDDVKPQWDAKVNVNNPPYFTLYPRLAQLVKHKSSNAITLPDANEQAHGAYASSYGLQTTFITNIGLESFIPDALTPVVRTRPIGTPTSMVVISKKHNVPAGLWDDVIPTFLPQVNDWTVATWKHGSSAQLPCACCRGSQFRHHFSTAIDKEPKGWSKLKPEERTAYLNKRRTQEMVRAAHMKRTSRFGCSGRRTADAIEQAKIKLIRFIDGGAPSKAGNPTQRCGGIAYKNSLMDAIPPKYELLSATATGIEKFLALWSQDKLGVMDEKNLRAQFKPICRGFVAEGKGASPTEAEMHQLIVELAPLLTNGARVLSDTQLESLMVGQCGGIAKNGGVPAVGAVLRLSDLVLAIQGIQSIRDSKVLETKSANVEYAIDPNLGNMVDYAQDMHPVCNDISKLTLKDMKKVWSTTRDKLIEIGVNALWTEAKIETIAKTKVCNGFEWGDQKLLRTFTLAKIVESLLDYPVTSIVDTDRDIIEQYRQQLKDACALEVFHDLISVARTQDIIRAISTTLQSPITINTVTTEMLAFMRRIPPLCGGLRTDKDAKTEEKLLHDFVDLLAKHSPTAGNANWIASLAPMCIRRPTSAEVQTIYNAIEGTRGPSNLPRWPERIKTLRTTVEQRRGRCFGVKLNVGGPHDGTQHDAINAFNALINKILAGIALEPSSGNIAEWRPYIAPICANPLNANDRIAIRAIKGIIGSIRMTLLDDDDEVVAATVAATSYKCSGSIGIIPATGVGLTREGIIIDTLITQVRAANPTNDGVATVQWRNDLSQLCNPQRVAATNSLDALMVDLLTYIRSLNDPNTRKQLVAKYVAVHAPLCIVPIHIRQFVSDLSSPSSITSLPDPMMATASQLNQWRTAIQPMCGGGLAAVTATLTQEEMALVVNTVRSRLLQGGSVAEATVLEAMGLPGPGAAICGGFVDTEQNRGRLRRLILHVNDHYGNRNVAWLQSLVKPICALPLQFDRIPINQLNRLIQSIQVASAVDDVIARIIRNPGICGGMNVEAMATLEEIVEEARGGNSPSIADLQLICKSPTTLTDTNREAIFNTITQTHARGYTLPMIIQDIIRMMTPVNGICSAWPHEYTIMMGARDRLTQVARLVVARNINDAKALLVPLCLTEADRIAVTNRLDLSTRSGIIVQHHHGVQAVLDVMTLTGTAICNGIMGFPPVLDGAVIPSASLQAIHRFVTEAISNGHGSSNNKIEVTEGIWRDMIGPTCGGFPTIANGGGTGPGGAVTSDDITTYFETSVEPALGIIATAILMELHTHFGAAKTAFDHVVNYEPPLYGGLAPDLESRHLVRQLARDVSMPPGVLMMLHGDDVTTTETIVDNTPIAAWRLRLNRLFANGAATLTVGEINAILTALRVAFSGGVPAVNSVVAAMDEAATQICGGIEKDNNGQPTRAAMTKLYQLVWGVVTATGGLPDDPTPLTDMSAWTRFMEDACHTKLPDIGIPPDYEIPHDRMLTILNGVRALFRDRQLDVRSRATVNAAHQWQNHKYVSYKPETTTVEGKWDGKEVKVDTVAEVKGIIGYKPAEKPTKVLSCDHSKMGWSNSGFGPWAHWVCGGDNNRQGGKSGITSGNVRRGGGAVCWRSPTLRDTLEAISTRFTCGAANDAIRLPGVALSSIASPSSLDLYRMPSTPSSEYASAAAVSLLTMNSSIDQYASSSRTLFTVTESSDGSTSSSSSNSDDDGTSSDGNGDTSSSDENETDGVIWVMDPALEEEALIYDLSELTSHDGAIVGRNGQSVTNACGTKCLNSDEDNSNCVYCCGACGGDPTNASELPSDNDQSY